MRGAAPGDNRKGADDKPTPPLFLREARPLAQLTTDRSP